MLSAVTRSVSKQMEEIANQQKNISEQQREEAIQQKKTADMMRQRSEVERMKALAAQEQAIISEHQAQDARQVAEAERQMAEHQRIQAEFSKRVADTLSYVALSRSLGSISAIQSQMGDPQLADLLAYASYTFSTRYNGDVYYPSVYQALLLASESKLTWARHKGSVMAMAYVSQQDDHMVTVSSYGEIMIHKKLNDQLQSKTLLSNSAYDFRDVFIDNQNNIYAISRSSHLVIITNDAPRILYIDNIDNPISILPVDDNKLLLIGDHGLAQYNIQRGIVDATRELNFHISASGFYQRKPLLFDDKGQQYIVNDINNLYMSPVPVRGSVSAFAATRDNNLRAYGMSDGTIYLHNATTGSTSKLQGHLSRISKLKFNGRNLFSSSYDGSVNLWNTSNEKIDPMSLISAGNWIMNFTFDASKQYVWIGDHNGNITTALLSASMMANMVRQKLSRDFTTDEWNYFIGRNVPYESFLKN